MIKEAIKKTSRSSDKIDRMLGWNIPLTPKMMKRIYPENKEMYYFHTINIYDMEKLMKMQGTKKQISCFDNWDMDYQIFQAPTGSISFEATVAVLKGEYSIKFPEDLWTMYDVDGTRWIDVDSIDKFVKDKNLKKTIKAMSDKIHQIIRKEFKGKVPADFTQKEKYSFMKTYYDATEKAFEIYAEALSYYSRKADLYKYNEIIGYNFEVVEFVVDETTYGYSNFSYLIEEIDANHTTVDGDKEIAKRLNKYKKYTEITLEKTFKKIGAFFGNLF